jgi:hypothetical protein
MKNWRKYNGALIPLTPPHIEVNTDGIEEKIKRNNAFFARWTSNFDQKDMSEFWHVICDKPMDLQDYSRNTRSKIRRGLKQCEMKKVEKKEVINKGFDSYVSAFKKYNSHLSPKSESEFKSEIENLVGNWDFWAIYKDSQMIGYSQNKIIDAYCDYSTIKFHPEYLKFYPSYALFFTMNQYYLNEKEFKYVNDGARSISHETNIQEFLIEKFRFRKAYCKLNIIYSLKVKLLLSLFYPCRHIIKLLKFGPFLKLNIFLYQEKIRRSYER